MRRLKKILKRLALALGLLVALALIANAILVWQTGKRLEERLSVLRAAGEPLSLPELGAEPPAPGADAAAVLKRIEPEVKALSKEMAPILNAPDNPAWTADDRKTLEAAFANHPTVLPALTEAAACPAYRSPLNYQANPSHEFIGEMLPFIQVHREVTSILKTQAELQLLQNDRDGAMRTCLTSLRISRHADNEPMLISYLVASATRAIGVGMANEILRAGPLAPDLYRELDAELAKHDTFEAFRHCLRGERAFGYQAFDELLGRGGWFTRAYVNDDKCYYLDLLADWTAKANSTYAQYLEYERAAKAEAGGWRHRLTGMLVPAVLKVREAEFRVRCMVRCLRVLNALVAKKLDAAPANLADLGLPPDAVTDSYTDKPLIVKRQDGQWVVYGLGTNLTDDGGDLDLLKDVGLGPVKAKK